MNPMPGTIVDRDVTHPFENDVYLAAHVAIQGTARPTHYHMLMDEANVPVDRFQAMLYEHCYQYQRATTPVSLCKSFFPIDWKTLAHCKQFLLSITRISRPSVQRLILTWPIPSESVSSRSV